MQVAAISDSLILKARLFSQSGHATPLEFYLGADEFRKQNFSECARLLQLVAEKFPDHLASKILLSQAYTKLEKYQQSLELLRSVFDQIHSSKSLEFYLKQIDIKPLIEAPEVPSKISIEFELKSHDSNFERNMISDQEELKNYIASETLAKIFISQGEFAEAIQVYEQLISRKPENRENYLQRIEELKARLEK